MDTHCCSFGALPRAFSASLMNQIRGSTVGVNDLTSMTTISLRARSKSHLGCSLDSLSRLTYSIHYREQFNGVCQHNAAILESQRKLACFPSLLFTVVNSRAARSPA